MTIGKRIILGFSSILAVFAVASGVSIWKFGDTQQNATAAAATLPGVLLVEQMKFRTASNYSLVMKYILESDPAKMAAIASEMKQGSELNNVDAAAYEQQIDNDAEKTLYAAFTATRKQYVEARKEILALADRNQDEQAFALLNQKLQPAIQAYAQAARDLSEFNVNASKASLDTIVADASNGTKVAWLGSALGLTIGALAAFLIIRSVSRALKQIAAMLSDGSTQVTSASSHVSSSSQSLAQGASEQAASLEESSSALEEMASMIRRNADTSAQASSVSEGAKTSTEQGNEAMRKMTAAITDIERSSQETAKIIKTIDEIAFQTNLLALNAAVEAARAGEAGKGFAVVAEEVRNLAMRSAEAAKNTSSLIEESVSKSKNGVSMAQLAAQSLTQINDATVKVTHLISEIAVACREQSTGIDHITQAVGQMDKVTQTNAANAEETAAASEELNAQAEQLQRCVRDLQALVGLTLTQSSATPSPSRVPQPATSRAQPAPSPAKQSKAKPARELIPLESAQQEGDFSDFSKAA